MTGPEHYAEAERMLKHHASTAEAQAHAILALTAAIVADSIMRRADRHEWDSATGQPDNTEMTR